MRKFQVLLRCIKLWARRRGLHCHLLGFFAGIHLAILAAYVCQRYPNASVNGLFTMFFEIFAHWPWQNPVSLHGQPTNRRRSDGCLMAIVMPCTVVLHQSFVGPIWQKAPSRKSEKSLCVVMLWPRTYGGMSSSGSGFLHPFHMLQNMNNFFAYLYVPQRLKSYDEIGLDGWNPASVTLFPSWKLLALIVTQIPQRKLIIQSSSSTLYTIGASSLSQVLILILALWKKISWRMS